MRHDPHIALVLLVSVDVSLLVFISSIKMATEDGIKGEKERDEHCREFISTFRTDRMRTRGVHLEESHLLSYRDDNANGSKKPEKTSDMIRMTMCF